MNSNCTLSNDSATELQTLTKLIHQLNFNGHSPATSGNYSIRSQFDKNIIFISESGIDKSDFKEESFIPLQIDNSKSVNLETNIKRKPSDETEIHLSVYRTTNSNCVIHSHKLETILFADLYPTEDLICLSGLEILKSFKPIRSHLDQITIPVFDNDQNISALAQKIDDLLTIKKNIYGILLRGHGLYVWGDSVKEAKKHLEAFNYLFNYFIKTKSKDSNK